MTTRELVFLDTPRCSSPRPRLAPAAKNSGSSRSTWAGTSIEERRKGGCLADPPNVGVREDRQRRQQRKPARLANRGERPERRGRRVLLGHAFPGSRNEGWAATPGPKGRIACMATASGPVLRIVDSRTAGHTAGRYAGANPLEARRRSGLGDRHPARWIRELARSGVLRERSNRGRSLPALPVRGRAAPPARKRARRDRGVR